MAIPYYIARPSGFMGLDKEDPDERPAGPFDGVPAEQAAGSPFEEPPSVSDSKATKPAQGSPFDEVDPRIKALDDEIKGRPGSIGGILAAFSPHGDRTMANLMAQRHLVGSEVHGDQQLKRQIESSRMLQESAFRRADAMEKAAAARDEARKYASDNSASARMYGADQSLAGSLARAERPMTVGAGASVYDPATGTNSAQNAFRPQADRNAPAAGKAPVNPQIPVIQAELRQITKVLNDPNVPDDQKAPLLRKYNIRVQQLKQLGGQPAPAPSAAPSTAPSVAGSGGPTDNDPLGIRN